MTSALLTLLLAAPALSEIETAPAVQLRFQGTLAAQSRDGATTPAKKFSLDCLVVNKASGGKTMAFIVSELGGGAWPWPERFGMVELDQDGKPTSTVQPRLLQEHDGTLYAVALPWPVFSFAERLKAGAEWTDGQTRYLVADQREIDGRNCWQVEIAGNQTRRQTLFVENKSPLIVAVEQRVFVGQGDQYRLAMQLESSKSAGADDADRLLRPFRTLAELQKQLNRDGSEQQRPELHESQLKMVASALPRLAEEAVDTPLEDLVTVINRDVKDQSQRVADLRSLADRFVGKQAPQLALKSLANRPVDTTENEGQIVLLHFWEYRHAPLTEPYGQIGYLDYLNNRRRKLGVKVYGIAVNSDPTAEQPTAAALRSARQLKEFMNLGYEVTADDGSVLKQFGDPRQLGGKLPLWVLIGPDGKIAHYHVGFYPIKPDEGLRELDEKVVALIRKQRDAE